MSRAKKKTPCTYEHCALINTARLKIPHAYKYPLAPMNKNAVRLTANLAFRIRILGPGVCLCWAACRVAGSCVDVFCQAGGSSAPLPLWPMPTKPRVGDAATREDKASSLIIIGHAHTHARARTHMHKHTHAPARAPSAPHRATHATRLHHASGCTCCTAQCSAHVPASLLARLLARTG